ncbi:MAG: hypothetical protein REV35_01230 [Burkholderia sp.]|nr:hypothetical protein [Burkholderia sp.]
MRYLDVKILTPLTMSAGLNYLRFRRAKFIIKGTLICIKSLSLESSRLISSGFIIGLPAAHILEFKKYWP